MSFGNKFFTAKSLSLACFTCMELLDVFKHSNDVEWKLDFFLYFIYKKCTIFLFFHLLFLSECKHAIYIVENMSKPAF